MTFCPRRLAQSQQTTRRAGPETTPPTAPSPRQSAQSALRLRAAAMLYPPGQTPSSPAWGHSYGPSPLWSSLPQQGKRTQFFAFMQAQIKLAHALILQELRGGLRQRYFPCFQDIARGGNRERHLRVLLNQQHGSAT